MASPGKLAHEKALIPTWGPIWSSGWVVFAALYGVSAGRGSVLKIDGRGDEHGVPF